MLTLVLFVTFDKELIPLQARNARKCYTSAIHIWETLRADVAVKGFSICAMEDDLPRRKKAC